MSVSTQKIYIYDFKIFGCFSIVSNDVNSRQDLAALRYHCILKLRLLITNRIFIKNEFHITQNGFPLFHKQLSQHYKLNGQMRCQATHLTIESGRQGCPVSG